SPTQSLSGQCSVAGRTQVDPVKPENSGCALADAAIASTANVIDKCREMSRVTSSLLLLLAGERAFAKTAEVHGAFHRVLALERSRVDDVEMRALDIDRELDRDLGAFDRAVDVGLP